MELGVKMYDLLMTGTACWAFGGEMFKSVTDARNLGYVRWIDICTLPPAPVMDHVVGVGWQNLVVICGGGWGWLAHHLVKAKIVGGCWMNYGR